VQQQPNRLYKSMKVYVDITYVNIKRQCDIVFEDKDRACKQHAYMIV